MSDAKASDRPAAVLYAAKSTEDKKGSIPDQLKKGRQEAEGEGWEVVGEHQDEAKSAYKQSRGSGLAAAMKQAEEFSQAGRETYLVVEHSDRLARGDAKQAAHLVEYAIWAIKAEVKIRSLLDQQTFGGLLYTVVTGDQNHAESAKKSEKVRAGMKRRAERGEFSGPRPFGYDFPKGGDGLKPNPKEAKVVKRIYREYVAGRSLSEIARELEADHVPTATKNGKYWRQSTISGILSNPVHIGKITYRGEVVCEKGVHEAIIDAETFQRAATLLEARSSRTKGRPPKGAHLFRDGLLRCESCDSAMVPRTRDSYELYYCDGRGKLGKEFCSMPTHRRRDVDEAVLSYFERVALDIEATKQALAESRDRNLAQSRAALAEAEKEVADLTTHRARIERDYASDELPAHLYAKEDAKLNETLPAAEAEVERLRQRAEEVENWTDLKDAEADTLRRLTEIRKAIAGEIQDAEGIDAVRAALTRLFESFTLSVPEDGAATITPKRRSGEMIASDANFDLSGETPELEVVLAPPRVPLEIAGSGSDEKIRQGLPCR